LPPAQYPLLARYPNLLALNLSAIDRKTPRAIASLHLDSPLMEI
jgi:hypothetical protein